MDKKLVEEKGMCDADMLELLTEGSQADREKTFKQKGDGLYRCVNRWGEEKERCILINESLIEDDEKWMSEQGNAKIDMELACKYEKTLEERFYQGLFKIEQWSNKVIQLCEIMREKKHPELRHKKGDSEEIGMEKADERADVFDDYSRRIERDIVEKFRNKGCDMSFVEEYRKAFFQGFNVPLEETRSKAYFLRNNMLYNIRKGGEAEQNHIEKVQKKVNAVIKSYCKTQAIKEKITGKDITDIDKKRIRKNAREAACEFIFLQKNWDVKLWMELIFLKFYKEIQDKKPKVAFVEGTRKIEKELLGERREWIKKECKKWFAEKGNYDIWQFTEKAVMELTELEDEDKRLDLMNYTIKPDSSIYPEIEMIIAHGDVKQEGLECEAGFYGRLLPKVLKGKDETNMNPYVACLLWKKCNVPFSRMFQITPIAITYKDKKVMTAYKEVRKPKHSIGAISVALEDNPNKSDFWYIPKKYRRLSQVCIELSGPEKIKITVEYFNLESLAIELPYSNAMERISNLEDEKVAEILEMAEFGTKEELIKYCAEMVVRNYCREFFGIPYHVFQRIKCHADVTITIHPLVFYKPDGTIQVGYAGSFKRNQMTRSGGCDYIELYEKQVWKNREELEKDWEKVKEQIILLLKEKWIEINEEKKYYSEYAMHMSDFFQVVYKEPYIIEEKDAERIIKRISTEDMISW